MVSPENASQSICEGGIGYLRLGAALLLMTMESRYQLYLYQVSAVRNDMTDKLDIFKYQGKEVRILKDEQGNLWWVAKDVCDILGIIDTRTVVERLDLDEWGKTTVIDSMGREQEAYIISESGLYEAVGRSNKPEAKVFQKWVRKEVLPSIRKTGSYSVMAQIPKNFADALRLAANQQDEIEKQKKQLAIAAPKEEFYDTISVRGMQSPMI
jgi:anti-repressor protein